MSEKTKKFFKGFSDCLKNTANMCTVGEQFIEVIEVADPDPISKAVLASIQAIMKISSPALLSLSKVCSEQVEKIDAEHQEELQKLGLVSKDGTVPGLVADIVKKTVVVTDK